MSSSVFEPYLPRDRFYSGTAEWFGHLLSRLRIDAAIDVLQENSRTERKKGEKRKGERKNEENSVARRARAWHGREFLLPQAGGTDWLAASARPQVFGAVARGTPPSVQGCRFANHTGAAARARVCGHRGNSFVPPDHRTGTPKIRVCACDETRIVCSMGNEWTAPFRSSKCRIMEREKTLVCGH